jgi:hypothetical protein
MHHVFWAAVAGLLAEFPFIPSGLAKDKGTIADGEQ